MILINSYRRICLGSVMDKDEHVLMMRTTNATTSYFIQQPGCCHQQMNILELPDSKEPVLSEFDQRRHSVIHGTGSSSLQIPPDLQLGHNLHSTPILYNRNSYVITINISNLIYHFPFIHSISKRAKQFGYNKVHIYHTYNTSEMVLAIN